MQISRVNYEMNSKRTSKCQLNPVAFGNQTAIPTGLLRQLTPDVYINFPVKEPSLLKALGFVLDAKSRLFVKRELIRGTEATRVVNVGIENVSPQGAFHSMGVDFNLGAPQGIVNTSQEVLSANRFYGAGWISDLRTKNYGGTSADRAGLLPLLQNLLARS